MRVELHTTPDVFDRLAHEWDDLLDPDRSDLFFVTPDFQRVWWKHLHRGRLTLLAVRDDSGLLRGLAPWFIEEVGGERVVIFVGCFDVSDYLDFPVQPGYEEQVFSALLDFMLSGEAPAWDRFELCNIPARSPTLPCLQRLAEDRGLTCETVLAEVCPVIDLPETYEAFIEQLDKKDRHELRRKRRRTEGMSAIWYRAGQEHDLDEQIDQFLTLMAMSTTAKAAFLTEPGHQTFFRELGHVTAQRDWLDLIFLTVNGQPAATMWQFAYRDRLLLYNSGMNQSEFGSLSPGIVLLTYSIEDAIERGLAKYDFLRGSEQYKYRMGARDTTVYTVHMRR